MKKYFLILFVLLFFLSACTAPLQWPAGESQTASEETPQPTPEAAQAAAIKTPEPVPEGLDLMQAESAFWTAWTAVEWSFQAVPEDAVGEDTAPLLLFLEEYEKRTWVLDLQSAIAAQLEPALENCARSAGETVQATYQLQSSVSTPSWQFLYTLIYCRRDRQAWSDLLRDALSLEVEMEELPDGTLSIHACLAPGEYQQVIASLYPDRLSALSGEFLYSYCFTAYDETANMREYIERDPAGNLTAPLVWPLGSHTRLRKTWYADRSGGTRRHMGTDIWAAEDTQIYSCTDGVVTFIGYSDGMGNAVIVEDAYGYEFHYYHMVRLPDFITVGQQVSAGELIGHVGNTGNSDRDHLHLTLVAPDGYYVNPYPYLEAVEPKK